MNSGKRIAICVFGFVKAFPKCFPQLIQIVNALETGVRETWETRKRARNHILRGA